MSVITKSAVSADAEDRSARLRAAREDRQRGREAHNPGEKLLSASIPTMTRTTAIDLDVTDGCNLGCHYCFKNLDKPNNMSLETAKDAIEWLFRASGDAETVHVNFMGGEPTLRFPMLKDLVKWGKRRARSLGKKIWFSFTSNMTLWNAEIRNWVDQEGIGVLMSIDGAPETQDAQRPSKNGKPVGETVSAWARDMLKTRPLADARMTLPPSHVHRLYENCLYLWEELGFTNVVMADADHENWTEGHFDVYREQLRLVCDYLLGDFSKGGRKSLKIIAYYLQKLILPRHLGDQVQRQNFPCGAGYNYTMVDQEGGLWPCHRFDGAAEDSGTGDAMKLGNIYSEAYNDRLSNVFRNFDHSKDFKPACRTCPVEPICGGFCPAANLSSTGSIYTPHENYCQLKWILYAESERLFKAMIDSSSEEAVVKHIAALEGGKEV